MITLVHHIKSLHEQKGGVPLQNPLASQVRVGSPTRMNPGEQV